MQVTKAFGDLADVCCVTINVYNGAWEENLPLAFQNLVKRKSK